MRVLVALHDAFATNVLKRTLAGALHTVDHTKSGEEATDLGKLYDYDVIILGLTLTDNVSGFDVMRSLRATKVHVPIIVVSRQMDKESVLKAFSLGADDYVGIPIQTAVLLARMEAVVRRSRGHSTPEVHVGELTINLAERRVTFKESSIYFTSLKWRILETLALHRGMSVTREVIIGRASRDTDIEVRTIDVHIGRLRKEIMELTGGVNFIGTIHGNGYQLCEPEKARFIPSGRQKRVVSSA